MGIKGLKKLIQKHAPEGITNIELKDLKGKTVCIDSSILIYQFRYINSSDNFHIVGFYNKIVEFLEIGIIPIFVFDGKPPEAKMETLKKRRENREKLQQKVIKLKARTFDEFIDTDSETENSQTFLQEISRIEKNILIITKQHYLDVIELLEYIGIQYYNEEFGEAEAYCAFLQKQGIADYILTEDTDSLTFGGSNVLFKSTSVKSSSVTFKFTLYKLENILSSLNFNQDEFIDLCILCGCDYTCTIPKIGPVNAYNIIKIHRNIDTFLNSLNSLKAKTYIIPDNFNYVIARNLFKQNNNYTLKTLKEPNIKKLIELYSEIFNVSNLINLINFNFTKNKFLEEY